MVKAPKSKDNTKITRISASDTSHKKSTVKVKPAVAAKKREATSKRVEAQTKLERRNPFAAIGRYLKGSWYELRQVRWPDRRSTWGMTGALIAFTLFFVIVILLLDYGFAQLFKLIMGSN